jgi:hypothetical protein
MYELVRMLSQGRYRVFDNLQKQAQADDCNDRNDQVAHAIENTEQIPKNLHEVTSHHSSP